MGVVIYNRGNSISQIPVVTTAEQPGTPALGMIRFYSSTSKFERYTGIALVHLY